MVRRPDPCPDCQVLLEQLALAKKALEAAAYCVRRAEEREATQRERAEGYRRLVDLNPQCTRIAGVRRPFEVIEGGKDPAA